MLAIITETMIHIAGGLEKAAKVTGVSKSSLSMYQRGEREVPPNVLRRLSAHISQLAPLSKDEALRQEHKETSEALQAGFSACLMIQRKETVESMAAQWMRLHSARSWYQS